MRAVSGPIEFPSERRSKNRPPHENTGVTGPASMIIDRRRGQTIRRDGKTSPKRVTGSMPV